MRKYFGLKIAQIDFGFNWPVRGGEQRRVYRMIEGLKELRFDPTLFVPSFRKEEMKKFDIVPIVPFYYPKYISSRKKIFSKHKGIIASLLNSLRKLKPDVIHHHFGTMKYLVNSIIAANKVEVPQVVTFHQFWPLCYRGTYWDFEGRVCNDKNVCGKCMLTLPCINKLMDYRWKKIVKWLLSSVANFITYSKFMKEKLERAGIEKDNISVIPYGVDFQNIPCEKFKREYVIFSGRLNREKGVDLFIKAVSKLRKKKLKVVIIGDGPQKEECKKFAYKLDLNIHFSGWLNNRKEYFQYLKKCFCVVVPSLWIENSPLVIGEAFACETPVIGTNSGGIPELINKSGAGFIVERDADEIAEKIKILIDNPKLREDMGWRGGAYAEKHFNWERNVEKLVKVYEKVLRER